jgi:hypothetical protein
MKNSVTFTVDKQKDRISYVCYKLVPSSLMHFENNTDGHALYVCVLLYRIK